MEKELKVSAIKNGTAIDRIPSNVLFKVINILGLQNCENQITFGMNLDSKKLGKKAIIKVTDRFFTPDEVNRIALIAPMAKLNIIRNYEVVEKREVEVPEITENILKCINPKCITNHENIKTKFRKVSSEPLEMQCCYCEKYIDHEHFEMINN
jgi:aspartate carbamoyltransferase regulatory subunit